MNKSVNTKQVNYPSLSQRYFATTVDVVLLIAVVIAWVKALSHFHVATDDWLWYLVFLPVLFYEPVMTSKAATLGQMVFRFRIRDVITGSQINLQQAYGRWIIKFVLGGVSLLTIPNDAQKRAIHDKMLATIAVSEP